MITVIGEFLGTSGYSNHTRGLANALNKITDVKLVTNLIPGWEGLVNDKELEMIKRETDYETNLIITNPLHWKCHLNAKRNFVYLIWEGDKIPQWMMLECLNPKIEKIIVPSTHTYNAVINTATNDYKKDAAADLKIGDKLIVIPHGYDPEDFYSQQPEVLACQGGGEYTRSPKDNSVVSEIGVDEQYPPADTFTFLANKGLRNLEDRGGIQYLIEAYLSEFTESEKVELILKINPAYGVPNLLNMFPNLKKNGIPKVTFIHDNYSKKQLNELYNKCDVFVSPTRAESFNLPCLEAMACGKPVITTNYGGQTDFCTNETGWLVDFDMTEVKHEIEYEGISWATPKMDDLKKQLRLAFETDLSLAKTKNAYQSSQNLTWENTANQILKLV